MFCLYQVTNLINGKYYIGVHHDADDSSYMGSGIAIRAAIKKYGRENFRRDNLALVETEKLAYQLEGAVVDQDFVGCVRTYNLTIGGRIPPNRKGIPHTPETCRGISASSTGRIVKQETRVKIGLAKLGQRHTEESNQKNRKSHLGVKRGPHSEGHKEAIKYAQSNHSPEERAEWGQKIHDAKVGKPRSPEVRRILSDANKGKPWSEARRFAHDVRISAKGIL